MLSLAIVVTVAASLVAFVVVVAAVAYRSHDANSERPIFDIYRRKSRWFPLKFGLYLSVYHTLRLLRPVGRPSVDERARFDRPLKLGDDIKAFDGVLFTGGNRQGYFFAIAAERCHKNVVNGYFYLLVPKIGLLSSAKVPDTVLFGGADGQFGAEGIAIAPVVPLKKWKIRYRGVMRLQSSPDTKIRVHFAASWSSSRDTFSVHEDAHPASLARSIAMESWTSEFFQEMRRRRPDDVHYYQLGVLRAESVVGGVIHDFRSQSFRCHVRGTKRHLLALHRSAFFDVYLENGMAAVIGMVSQRSIISSLEVGYVQKRDGSIQPIEWCDFQLYQHGECGQPPQDHGFQFKAGDTIYTMQMIVLKESVHYVGWNWETRVVERFVKCIVNGVLGQGVSEFRYRHRSGRPSDVNEKDPPWFQVHRPLYIYS